MSIPHKATLFSDTKGLARITDHERRQVLTAALINAVQGTPLDAEAEWDELLEESDGLHCFANDQLIAILIRYILRLLEALASAGGGGGVGNLIFGEGSPEGVVTATRAVYIDQVQDASPKVYYHATEIPSNTGWVPIL